MHNDTLHAQYQSLVENGIIKTLPGSRNTNPALVQNCVIVYRDGDSYDVNNTIDANFILPIIARSLSNQARFNGHTNVFYSVAQHCCRMAESALIAYGDPKLALACLLHESEHLIGDIVHPYKALFPQELTDLEQKIDRQMFRIYGIEEYYGSELLKKMDVEICTIEMETMLFYKDWESSVVNRVIQEQEVISDTLNIAGITGGIHDYTPAFPPFTVNYWSPEVAYNTFMSTYYYLYHLINDFTDTPILTKIGSHKAL